MPVKDRRLAEAEAHKKAEEIARERNGEWFHMPIIEAISLVENFKEE